MVVGVQGFRVASPDKYVETGTRGRHAERLRQPLRQTGTCTESVPFISRCYKRDSPDREKQTRRLGEFKEVQNPALEFLRSEYELFRDLPRRLQKAPAPPYIRSLIGACARFSPRVP